MSTKPLPPPTPSQWATEKAMFIASMCPAVNGLVRATMVISVDDLAKELDAAKAQGAKEEREAISVMLEGNADAISLLPEDKFWGKESSVQATRNLAKSVRARGAAGKSS